MGKPHQLQEDSLGKLLLLLLEVYSDKLQQQQEVFLVKLQHLQHPEVSSDKLQQLLVVCLDKASQPHKVEVYLVQHQFYKLHQIAVLRKEVYLEYLLHQQAKPLVVYSLCQLEIPAIHLVCSSSNSQITGTCSKPIRTAWMVWSRKCSE